MGSSADADSESTAQGSNFEPYWGSGPGPADAGQWDLDLNLNSDWDFYHTSPSTSFWQRLPAEVIWLIVCFIRPREDNWAWRKDEKKGLAACSLVCCYWALSIRPLLFRTLELEGRAHVDELLAILSAPPAIATERLAKHIQRITYRKHDDHVPPWLRLKTISARVPAADFCVDIRGVGQFLDSVSGNYVLSGDTIFRGLPKTLPSSALPACTELRISRVHFTSSADIIRLVHAFPSANRQFYGGFSTSKTASGNSFAPRHSLSKQLRLARAKHVQFYMQDQKQDMDFKAQLEFALTAAALQERFMVQRDAWEIIHNALLILVSSRSEQLEVIAGTSKAGAKYCYLHISVNLRRVYVRFSVVIWLSEGASQDSDSSNRRSICRVELDLNKFTYNPLVAGGLVDCNWEGFESELLRLEPVPTLCVINKHSQLLLQSILEGKTLGRMTVGGHLMMFRDRDGPGVTRAEVLGYQTDEAVSEKRTRELSLPERFDALVEARKRKGRHVERK